MLCERAAAVSFIPLWGGDRFRPRTEVSVFSCSARRSARLLRRPAPPPRPCQDGRRQHLSSFLHRFFSVRFFSGDRCSRLTVIPRSLFLICRRSQGHINSTISGGP
ncbi:hypothetical protein NDU88_003121 [Pleurodeles waltl]|uniref:Uncharacterized protein n=1 Tax=Pleurodeles waltl TaxID=8319 RepID=A0AAV7KXN1_PLEWA|nr:hypothetical protein NDU88_003121 [Pleurodeles waltl]